MYKIMSWSLQHTEMDDSLTQMMHQCAAFYMFLTQLRAMRALFRNPEVYAAKLVNDSPKAIQFKNSKSIPALQQLLNKMCAKTAPTPGTSSATAYHSSQLCQQLVNLAMGTTASTSFTAVTTTPAEHTAADQLTPPTAPPSQITNQLMDFILQL